MSMLEWARNEVRIACERENPDRKEGEWDYGCACYESALKAFECLMEDPHTGYSFGVTKDILIRLMNHIPLTPLKGTDDEWAKDESQDDLEYETYQNIRRGSLWKNIYPDGRVEFHDNDRVYFVNAMLPNCTWFSGLVNRIVHEMYPIKFPYVPEEKSYIIYGNEYLTDRKNGDFDTIELLYVKTPSGEEVEIKRYFAESPDGWKEISFDECYERKLKHQLRETEEKGENKLGT